MTIFLSANQTMAETEAPRIPVLLKTLLGKVHANARELKNPESFSGIIFYNASKINSGRPDSYRVILKNAQPVTDAEFQQIRAILNSEHEQPNQQVETPRRGRRTQSDIEDPTVRRNRRGRRPYHRRDFVSPNKRPIEIKTLPPQLQPIEQPVEQPEPIEQPIEEEPVNVAVQPTTEATQ